MKEEFIEKSKKFKSFYTCALFATFKGHSIFTILAGQIKLFQAIELALKSKEY